jgi:hypothetical protein
MLNFGLECRRRQALSRDPSLYLDRIALRPHTQTTSNTPNSTSIHSVHHRGVFFYFEGQEQKGVERSGLHIVFIAFNCGSDLGVLLEADFGATRDWRRSCH